MKRTIFMLFTAMMFINLVSCSKCSHKEEQKNGTITTEVVKMDKAHMDSINTNYKYFETCFVFDGTVDTLSSPDVNYVQNVFQIVDAKTNEPIVFVSEHFLKEDSVNWGEKVGAFWVGDLDLRTYIIKLSLEDAFEQLQKANIIKPQSKYCVLRAAIGPKYCNAQYIFGNDELGVVFVDAVNGNVTNIDPAFDEFDVVNRDSIIISER